MTAQKYGRILPKTTPTESSVSQFYPQDGDSLQTGKSPDVQALLDAYFSDPMQVESYRRLLRSMFSSFIVDFEGNFSPFNFDGSRAAYEILDELLSGLAYQAYKSDR